MNKEVKYLIDRYYQTQEHRIAMAGQVRELKKLGEDTNPLEDYYERFHAIEKDIAKYISGSIRKHSMAGWLKKVKGIGPILSAALLSTIDIGRAEHASSVWKYAGLAPGQKRTRGTKIDYNPFLKTICWKIGESFVKTKGEYRKIYDTSKEFYQRKFPEEKTEGKRKLYTKGHIHAMAKRRTVKLFLAHFWAEWRKVEGLPVSEPFMHRGI